jgi:hypothetical protein
MDVEARIPDVGELQGPIADHGPRDLRGSHGSTAAQLRPGVFEEPACAGAYVGAVSTLTDDATATFTALVTP